MNRSKGKYMQKSGLFVYNSLKFYSLCMKSNIILSCNVYNDKIICLYFLYAFLFSFKNSTKLYNNIHYILGCSENNFSPLTMDLFVFFINIKKMFYKQF